MNFPTCEEFRRGIEEFEKQEKRDAMYKVATFLISHFWGKPSDMADSLGVLLLTWNQAFYRYGSFDFGRLEKCIRDNFDRIKDYRAINIREISDISTSYVTGLFMEFNEALQIASGKKMGVRSPVAAAKCLRLLAPKFFPLWDDKIARAYECHYDAVPEQRYVSFCWIIKKIAEVVGDFKIVSDKSIVKLIDEYNYSKYTRKWI